jgi:hypothetical protein
LGMVHSLETSVKAEHVRQELREVFELFCGLVALFGPVLWSADCNVQI